MIARILIIEDNPANLELAKYLLEAGGYTILTAMNGVEGLELAQRERPDLVVSDLQMPLMDGYEVLQKLRSNPDLQSIPVIAVTAFSMPGDKNKVLLKGFNGYISKPIVPETFIQQVEAFLPVDLRAGSPEKS
jgi:two-component system, cell cycle response regulator DivK